MDNPNEIKPLEPLSKPLGEEVKPQFLTEKPEKTHKKLSLGKLITIGTVVLLLAVVGGIIIYSQNAARYKGDVVLTHQVAPTESEKPVIEIPTSITEVTPSKDILEQSGDIIKEQPSVAGVTETIDTGIELNKDLVVPVTDEAKPEAGLGTEITIPEIAIVTAPGVIPETDTTGPEVSGTGIEIPESVTKPTDLGVYRDDSQMIPQSPGTSDAVIPETTLNLDLQKELLDSFKDSCNTYKAELDYAYYHDDWIGTEKSYAASLNNLKNGKCLSECEFAFYDGILQLHSENYMLNYEFDPMLPGPVPQSAKSDILTILSACTDKCDKIFDLYAFFVEYAKSQTVYSQTDEDMMHYLIDRNIETCQQCMELENPTFAESKYFTKEFEKLLDDIRVQYGDAYLQLNTEALLESVPSEEPNLGGPQVKIPVAYAASEPITKEESIPFSPSDAIVTAGTSVTNDISNYLKEKCPEPETVTPVECTEVHFVDPGNPATRINSFDAIYNQTINNEPLLVQATGISGNVKYLFTTDTPINPNLQFTDTVNTGNPLITESPRINLNSGDIVTEFDQISVTVVDENNNPVGTCTDQISLLLADMVGEEEGIITTSTSSGGGTTSGTTTSSGTTTTTTDSGTTSGSTAGGGTLPRCNNLQIIRPIEAKADGTPTVNLTEDGYLNETLTINVVASAGSVSNYRFKSLNGTISFNNQGTTLDVPSSTKSVSMNGGPDAGQEDTVTVWALDDANTGIQSCHDAFVVRVPEAIVAGSPETTEETIQEETEIPAEHEAAPVVEEPVVEPTEEPVTEPTVHEGAEETPAAPEETEEIMPPTTPDDGPGVLIYFIGAGLGGLIFSRKKKNK